MQLIPILLVVAVVLASEGAVASPLDLEGGVTTVTVLTWGPIALAVALMQAVVWWAQWRVHRTREIRPLIVAERLARVMRWLIVVHHVVALLLLGWLDAIHTMIGDQVFVDELVALLPALVGLSAIWWVYFPIERLLRRSMVIDRIDRGLPVSAGPSRRQYLVQQLQVHLLIMLVPILLILASSELIERSAAWMGVTGGRWWIVDAVTLVAALGVFMVAPLLTRLVLTVHPLSSGPMREDLLDICARHRVRVRDILVWKTGDSMINAAVMGLVRQLRYVLLTDALLHLVPRPHLSAVMAHEIAHVRRHHLPWLLVTLFAALTLAVVVVSGALSALQASGMAAFGADDIWIDVLSTGLQLVIALLIFGWASRRFERQADTFAVQDLSGLGGAADGPDAGVRPEAVYVMCDALDLIARLNAVDPRRRSWRHGSIAWRQAYLRTLVGKPLHGLAIDRLVRVIKFTSVLVLIAVVVIVFLLGQVPA